MKKVLKVLKVFFVLLLTLLVFIFVFSFGENPSSISYGVSFSKLRAEDLNLDWKQAYLATLDDLKVRKLRLSAHWPMVEPREGEYVFTELEYQISEAQKRDAEVILAVGRRLPGWPECHVPDWAKGLPWEEQKKSILLLIEEVVSRFASYENIKYWQVENEPFLEIFAHQYCGDLDEEFLKQEIALVKRLDQTRPILVTDSGNLGLWHGAWKSGDAFGTSLYIYLWNPELGQVKSVLWPSFYKTKKNIMSIMFGRRESFLIELSLEPWLIAPAIETPLEIHFNRMDVNKFNEIIRFAKRTGFESQYLWGVEWWYWMKNQGHGEFWEGARELLEKSDFF